MAEDTAVAVVVDGHQVAAVVDGHQADGLRSNTFHKQKKRRQNIECYTSIESPFCHYHSLTIYLLTMNVFYVYININHEKVSIKLKSKTTLP